TRRSDVHLRPTTVARSTMLRAHVAFAMSALLAAAAPASAAAPVPCPGVRFLVGETLVPGGTQPFDVITIDAAGNASIASGCAASPARTVRRRGGGGFRARWAAR